jgi:preprotein translocase subunit SecG
MVQNPKGGGLSSSIGGSQMLGGVKKTSDFLDKSTWTLATVLIVLVMLSSLSFSGSLNDNSSKVFEDSKTAPAKTEASAKEAPAKTTEQPAEQTPATTTPAEGATPEKK